MENRWVNADTGHVDSVFINDELRAFVKVITPASNKLVLSRYH